MKRFALAVQLLGSIALLAGALQAKAADPEVCWKHTLTRPVHGVPDSCPGGQHQAGLCYPNCPPGFTGVGVGCWANCPPGWQDHGAGCTKPATYTRGAHVLIGAGPANCAAEAQGRGCEQFGALLYPRPRPGYECGAGGLICSVRCPAGWHDTGLTCVKPTQARPVAGIPQCGSGLQYQAGLCYRQCSPGYDGVGVVCWGRCDKDHPVDCGALCGRTEADCAQAITEQIVSVLEVIANVASTVLTAGTSTGATAGANAAKQAAQASGKAAIGSAAKQMAKNVTKDTIRATIIKQMKSIGKDIAKNQLENLVNAASGEEFDWTSLDPTGIAAAVQAFNKPICVAPQMVAGPLPATRAAATSPLARPTAPNVALAGKLIKGADSATVYLVSGAGIKHPIASPDVLAGCGLNWSMLQILDAATVHAVQAGPTLPTPQACLALKGTPNPRLAGSLIKASDSPVVYLVSVQGEKHPIVDVNVFNGCGLSWSALQTLSPAAVNAVQTGAALTTPQACTAIRTAAAPRPQAVPASAPRIAPGMLVKSADNPTVYLVNAQGQKQPIASAQVFTGCNLKWPEIVSLPADAVRAVPMGAALDTPQKCVATRNAIAAGKKK